ncbi:NAD(P)-binding protein [Coemansia reversa NRRL 1564]|uniref:NAD(P)-binding protein n=1 Tax=Coemansia reversa (strain ATCC 12441 / NRRL 1564) TaxID=763665 RepID=A0A2G5BK59_COERN|nr:NAD(P)-binding protein [Coemansia reversa NRRL 1564]|eukprot:PIA19393.1 NAD(P)-binding protein [Coemansia reversa NRRL 1564]
MAINTRITLVRNVSSGAPTLEDFKAETVPTPTRDSLGNDEVLIRTLYLSCDPYMRGRLSGRTDSYVASFKPGMPVDGLGVGIVEASTSSELKEGDAVTGAGFKWETKFTAPAKNFTKVSSSGGVSLIDYLGVLGMPSFTAYVGTVTLCKAKAGETILVSAASGAVGQMVIQLAKARGLYVIGSAGSDEKVQHAKDLGADVAFNYKTVGDLDAAIKKAAPEGLDVYFDNVGGEFLDAALVNMKPYGRIAECGMISQYNATPENAHHIKNLMYVVMKKVTMYGFIVTDYYTTPVYPEFVQTVSAMLKDKKIQYKIDEVAGLENGPQALLGVLEGKNFGKRIIKVSDPPHRL